MKYFKYITINSSITFVIATILQMTLHECGHFLAHVLIGGKDVVLHHNYVSSSTIETSVLNNIFYAAAGPIVSLTIGFVFHAICSVYRQRNMFFLFSLYMSIFGYIAFFGYLIMAPFFSYGDTGYIFTLLNFPVWLTIAIAIISGGMLYFIIVKLVKHFMELGTSEIVDNNRLRHVFMTALVRYPLFIGIVTTTLLNLPTPSALSLIYPFFSPFCIFWGYHKAVENKHPIPPVNKDLTSINSIQPLWIFFLLLVVIINRLLV